MPAQMEVGGAAYHFAALTAQWGMPNRNDSLTALLRGLALAALALPAAAAAAPALTLNDAIDRAVAHDPALRGADAGRRLSRGQVAEARSMLLPRLDATAGGVYTNHPVQAFGLALLQDDLALADMDPAKLTDPDAKGDLTARLDLQANLVDVAAWYALAAAGHGADAAEAARAGAEARLVAQVVGAYHGLQLAVARAKVAGEAVAVAEADVERARAQAAGGSATEADVLGLQAALAALTEDALVARGDAELAAADLDRLLGMETATAAEHVLTTPLDAPAPVVAATTAPRPDHPQLREIEAQVEAASSARRRATMAYLPTLGVQASVEGHRAELGQEGGNAWFAGAFLRMNLFAGLGDAARGDMAEANLERAVAARDEVRAGLALALRRAHLAVGQAEGRVRMSTEAVTHARESHRLLRARFENGMAQAADVLRSRSAQLEAEMHLLHAQYARHMAAAALAAADGSLNRTWNTRSEAR